MSPPSGDAHKSVFPVMAKLVTMPSVAEPSDVTSPPVRGVLRMSPSLQYASVASTMIAPYVVEAGSPIDAIAVSAPPPTGIFINEGVPIDVVVLASRGPSTLVESTASAGAVARTRAVEQLWSIGRQDGQRAAANRCLRDDVVYGSRPFATSSTRWSAPATSPTRRSSGTPPWARAVAAASSGLAPGASPQ